MSGRRIYFDGGPMHGQVREIPDSGRGVYYIPVAPKIGFGAEFPDPTTDHCGSLAYRAQDRYVVDVPTKGEDAQVYELDVDVRASLLPDALMDLVRESRALKALLPSEVEMLDRIVWTALQRARR